MCFVFVTLGFQPGGLESYPSSFLPFFYILAFIQVLNHHLPSFTALNKTVPTLLSFLSPRRRWSQDPAPIFPHRFWDPEMRDFWDKPSFLSPLQVHPLPHSFPCCLLPGAKSSLGLSLGVHHAGQGHSSAELPGGRQNAVEVEPARDQPRISSRCPKPRSHHWLDRSALEGHSFREEAQGCVAPGISFLALISLGFSHWDFWGYNWAVPPELLLLTFSWPKNRQTGPFPCSSGSAESGWPFQKELKGKQKGNHYRNHKQHRSGNVQSAGFLFWE